LLGDKSLVSLPDDGGEKALADLDQIKILAGLGEDPYEPVGWSKCSSCRFFQNCWDKAERQQDVSLIVDVNQAIARSLHDYGITTYVDLARPNTIDQLKTTRASDQRH
jgi:predicted RecB family nuclease